MCGLHGPMLALASINASSSRLVVSVSSHSTGLRPDNKASFVYSFMEVPSGNFLVGNFFFVKVTLRPKKKLLSIHLGR